MTPAGAVRMRTHAWPLPTVARIRGARLARQPTDAQTCIRVGLWRDADLVGFPHSRSAHDIFELGAAYRRRLVL
jgi:hypothetical protein